MVTSVSQLCVVFELSATAETQIENYTTTNLRDLNSSKHRSLLILRYDQRSKSLKFSMAKKDPVTLMTMMQLNDLL